MARAREEKNRCPNFVSSSPVTGKNIREIPTDLINEILLTMDATTLCRLRCVSRWWNAHISSPTFCLLHYHRSLNRRRLHLLQVYRNPSRRGPYEYEYFFSSTDLARPDHRNLCDLGYPEKKIIEAAGSSSFFGLICMSISNALHLYNPTTRSIVADLPPFNYQLCKPKLALGFAHSTNQFKVICFFFSRDSACKYYRKNHVDFKVLTIPEDLSTGWRAVPSPNFAYLPNLVAASSESAVYALIFSDQSLFRFDLKAEFWSPVKLPPSVKTFHDIGEFEGSICLVNEKSDLCYEIWLLRDGSKWVKEWALIMRRDGTSLIPLRRDGEYGRLLIMTFFGRLHFYQNVEGVFEEVYDFFEYLQGWNPCFSLLYLETFASLATLCDISAAKH